MPDFGQFINVKVNAGSKNIIIKSTDSMAYKNSYSRRTGIDHVAS